MTQLNALKFDGEKPRLDLVPDAAVKEIAKVFTFGAKKYAPNNWREGFEWHRLIRAAKGHIADFNDGEDLDPESGLSHLAHAGCCILMLLDHIIKGYGIDDRYTTLKKKGLNLSAKNDKIVFQCEEIKWQQPIAKNCWSTQPYTVSAITLETTVPKPFEPSMRSSMMSEDAIHFESIQKFHHS